MKKKILCLAFLTLIAFSVSSCGTTLNVPKINYNNDNTINYDNENIKGKTVDSINLNVSNQNSITINNTDTYQEMINKLTNANYQLEFGVKKLNNDISPFYEKFSESVITNYNNFIIGDFETNNDGEITKMNNNHYSAGNAKSGYYRYANTTSLINNSFYLGSEATYELIEIDSNNHKGYSYEKNEDLNKGFYYKLDGNNIEFATNRNRNNNLYTNDSTAKELMKESNIYYNYDLSDNNSKVLKAENYDITFDESSLIDMNIVTQTGSNTNSEYNYNISKPNNGNLEYVPTKLKNRYELTFELTDKYLIIKNKISLPALYIRQFNTKDMNYTDSKIDEIIKMNEGSIYYQEVWLDYKNYIQENNYNYIGYDYFKESIIEKQNYEDTWTTSNQSESMIKSIEEAGLNGKKYNTQINLERNIETYIIQIDNNVIEEKKEELIRNCKNNNFLDKYSFKTFAIRFNLS